MLGEINALNFCFLAGPGCADSSGLVQFHPALHQVKKKEGCWALNPAYWMVPLTFSAVPSIQLGGPKSCCWIITDDETPKTHLKPLIKPLLTFIKQATLYYPPIHPSNI